MKNFSNPDGLVRSDFPGGWEGDKIDKFTKNGRTPQENEAWDHISILANYRKESTALQTGKLMQFVPEDGVYAYFRYTDDGKKDVMILVNTEDKVKELNTSRFEERTSKFTSAINVLTKEKLNSIKTISVPARTTLVLELN
ncbi:cyclomaltodextrinase C-terminal domain-containing protein [Pedobacter steynii]